VAAAVGLLGILDIQVEGLAVAVAETELVLVQMQPTTGQEGALVAAMAWRVWAVTVSKELFWSK
jgi:hypothetical protein